MLSASASTRSARITIFAPAKCCPRAKVVSQPGRSAHHLICRADVAPLTGVVFQPFSEVREEVAIVSKTNEQVESFARSSYANDCEAAINEQINIEYNVSYVYHALFAYFNRDNVALPGFASFFKAASDEERDHAELLMKYQNTRGGRVKLQSIIMPEMEFNNAEKGDALYAMELALSLEKLNFQKLRDLHTVAEQAGDAQMCDFVEGELLNDQVQSVKQIAEFVSQLRRVGKGLGVFEFDKFLQEQANAA